MPAARAIIRATAVSSVALSAEIVRASMTPPRLPTQCSSDVRSLDLDAGGFDDIGVHGNFGFDEGAHVFRRTGGEIDSELKKLLLHGGVVKRCVQRAVQHRYDLIGRA